MNWPCFRQFVAREQAISTDAGQPAHRRRKTPRSVTVAQTALRLAMAAALNCPVHAGAVPAISGDAAVSTVSGTVLEIASQNALHTLLSSPSAALPGEFDTMSMPSAHTTPARDVLSSMLVDGRQRQPDFVLSHEEPVTVALCRAEPGLCMTGSDDAWFASRVSVPYSIDDMLHVPLFEQTSPEAKQGGPSIRSGSIERNLRETLAHADLPADTWSQVARIFAGRLDVNVDASAQPGDSYRILYDGADESDPASPRTQVLAVEVILQGRMFSAAWFQPAGKTTGAYYSYEGEALAAAPFILPVRGARISSPFGMRVHPVRGERREHTGVDLAAPAGTAVTAAAAGTVRFVGFDRSGYGRYVVVTHAGGYTTYYAHLSAIAVGLRAGAEVKIGQRLGAVGCTGVATGPHLHFEVRRNSEPTDPLVLTRSNAAPALAGADLVAFEQQTDAARQQLAASSAATQLAASFGHRLSPSQVYAF